MPQIIRAGTNMITTTSQGAGATWTNAIWRTNNGAGGTVGGAVTMIAGNTYTAVSNNVPFGNNVGNTRLRNNLTNSGAVVTFLGDSLTLYTNTEIRAKNVTQPAALTPTLNFPGVGGNPGLILDGGILNAGDDGLFVISGKIQVAGQSYICPGDNGGGPTARPNRRFTISGDLSGPGTMVIFQSQTNNPQTISGAANTFSGQWIVKAGRLLGTFANSLGTNSITCDPTFTLPSYFSTTAPVADIAGPAVLEVNYNLNSAGVLTLTNGGKLRLHQEVCFTAVRIHDPSLGIDTTLAPGIHYFTELIANYPNNFDPGGSGALVVQPFGTPPPLPPSILTQPFPVSVYTNAPARFLVSAADNGFPPLTYQWRRDGTNLSNAANISGVTNSALVVSNASGLDAAVTYDVIVGNASFSVTSSVAGLTLAGTNGEAYEATVVAGSPLAFYQLDETSNPASGSAQAYDYVNGYAGLYGAAVQNGFNGVNGPTSADGLPGFNAGNKAALFTRDSVGSRITARLASPSHAASASTRCKPFPAAGPSSAS